MNTTVLYNRVADKINRKVGATIVTTCQVPVGHPASEYFKGGVALQVDDLEWFNYIMRAFEDIEIGENNYWLEPWDTTLVGVWE